MKSAKYASAVTIFLWWSVCETAGNNCTKGVSWKDTTYYRQLHIQGEWLKINCAIRTSENVTLWFGKKKNETTKKLEVDNKKIKLISKNVFNITNLTTEDYGWYTCQVCGKKHVKFLQVPDQGKAYAKPIVVKKPNKSLYEIKDSVKLTCHAEGITVAAYDITWYKLNSDKKFERLRSGGNNVNGMWTETLSLTGLSERDEGTYKCQINRYPLKYSANKLINISIRDPFQPKIRIELVNLQPSQGEDFSLSYNVSSYPASHIKWWRSKNGIHYELIAECPPSEGCKKYLGKQNISKTSFEIKDLTFPDDEFFYKCNVSSEYGNDSKIFQLEVYVKPRISLNSTHIYEKGMIINCTLEKNDTNPPQVNFTWYLYDTSKCDKKKLITESYSLRLESQSKTLVYYRCEAKNKAGSDYQDIEVVKQLPSQTPSKPEINIEPDNLHPNQGEDFSLSYDVQSHLPSHIKWWRSKKKSQYQLIAQCPPSGDCVKNFGKEIISNTSFRVKNLQFPEDEFFYKCNASNKYGNDSKEFQLEVYVKPTISLGNIHTYEKGMIINCTLGKGYINPPEVNFTWYSCATSKCDKKKLISQSYSLHLKNQSKPEMNYRCEAKNDAGKAHKDIVVQKDQQPSSSNQKETMLSIVVPLGVTSMIILVATCFLLYRRKKIYGGFYLFSYPPLPDYMAILDDNGNIQDQLQKLPFIPEWEFPRERITLVSELGSGQFGTVWLAEGIGISTFRPKDILRERAGRRRFSSFNRRAKRNNYEYCKEVTRVAVKTVKDNHVPSDLADLQSELKILIHVGENKNIVNILGVCTKGKKSEIWIIMEYCPHGNLREFLRNSRSQYNVDENGLITDLSQVFGPKNLIYFGLQIAKGMNFLISRKVIHRDLAARNILIGDGYVAKVSNFGLARDAYKHQEYVRKSTGMVPFKWMALESIIDSVYTEKSDVWSFGVLLWELFTLGETPYPGISVNEIRQSLLEGKRMKPPIHCPQEICNIMSRCWAKSPDERPDFSSLNETFSEILGFEPISQVPEFFDEVTNNSHNESIQLSSIKPDVEDETSTLLCVA